MEVEVVMMPVAKVMVMMKVLVLVKKKVNMKGDNENGDGGGNGSWIVTVCDGGRAGIRAAKYKCGPSTRLCSKAMCDKCLLVWLVGKRGHTHTPTPARKSTERARTHTYR